MRGSASPHTHCFGMHDGNPLPMRARIHPPEYDIPSLYMVSFYCFVTKACARRPGAAASVERRRRERRTLLAGPAGELAGATRLRLRQAFERMHILYHPPHHWCVHSSWRASLCHINVSICVVAHLPLPRVLLAWFLTPARPHLPAFHASACIIVPTFQPTLYLAADLVARFMVLVWMVRLTECR